MRRFTQLFCELDRTTRTNEKVAALEKYFREAPAADAAWALQFLTGRTLARVVTSKNLRQWVAAEANLPEWMIAECYDAVGDVAETIALLLPNEGQGTDLPLGRLVEERLLPLPNLPDSAKRTLLLRTLRELNSAQRLVWNKLITGEFRIGAARTLVIRALANVAQIEPAIMSHRVLGKWRPTAADFAQLLSKEDAGGSLARPYPFFLASPLEIKLQRGETLADLGELADWQVEWKWDGIRAQLIRRDGQTLVWSRGDEMITDSVPEIAEAAARLPEGTVLDGEIVAWRDEAPLPFAALQRRLGRKSVGAETRERFPIAFLAYDLLEAEGIDVRSHPLTERRQALEKMIKDAIARAEPNTLPAADTLPGFETLFAPRKALGGADLLRLSPIVHAGSWDELAARQKEARERGVEGLMLKKKASAYGVGRPRGDWWKWKIDPFVIDAVLVAAQRGHGRRASLFTDYTFAVWQNGELTPVAKAYSGLTDEEILEVDLFVRHNTTERFGPVRAVSARHVFELAFEGVQKSTRHKSGVAVRFPRISRWRRDKKPAEADTLEQLLALTAARGENKGG